ncbi:MAG: thioredoxin family protein, partial [Desulfococcaceae bacterium]
MSNGMDTGGPQGQMSQQQIMAQLRRTFESFPHDIPIYHFVDRGKDDVFAQTNRQVVRAFRELSDKITMREYALDHELARKYNVTHSPTLVVAPERFNIHWVGAPLGEEGRTFLELLILVGMENSQLKEGAARVLHQIDEPRNVKVFVSPTCPYCPQQALNGVQAAVERPEMVHLEIVDIQCNPELADKYSAHSVPQTWANETLIAMGAQTPELFCLSLQKLEQQTV